MSARNVLRLLSAALKSGQSIDLASGDTLQVLPVVDNQGSIEIGDGTTDLDLKVFLGASTDIATFDVSAGHLVFDNAEINMGDNDEIEFGDAPDIGIQWDGTFMVSAPPTGFWSGCPSRLDPQPGTFTEIFDDFVSLSYSVDSATLGGKWNLDSAATAGIAKLGDAITANTPGVGGYVEVSCGATDNDFAFLHAATQAEGAGFLFAATGLRTWFEISFIVDRVTDCSYYIGMFGGTDIKPFTDASGAESVTDGIYFRSLTATPTEIDFCINQGGTESIIGENADVLATNTLHKLGFTSDGTTVTPFYDGVAGTTTTHAATNFPTDKGLTPGFGVLSGTTNVCKLFVDYVKVVQLR